jgi:hypothetical protein
MDPSISPPLPQALPVPRPLRRRRAVLLLIAIVILAPFLLWGYSALSTRSSWAAAEAEADLDTPRWRLMELEADRPEIPDKENSALHLIAIRRKAGRFAVGMAPNYEKIFEKLPPTAQLNQQQSDLLRGELAKIAKQLAEARTLKDLPHARYTIIYTDDVISTLIADHQESRMVVEWLQNDAMMLAHDKESESNAGARSVRRATRVLTWRVMEAGKCASEEQKSCMVVRKNERLVEAFVFLRDHLPQMEIFLRAAHLPRLATASVGEGEKVEQTVVHQP